MSIVQRLVKWLPNRWAASVEAESRRWFLRCTACGRERSLWEAGGVRWKASGTKNILARCTDCNRIVRAVLYHKETS